MHLKRRFSFFLSALVDVFTSRVDLASAEFEDLVLQLGGLLVLLLGGALLVGLALLFLGLTAIMAVPEGYRWIPALIDTILCGGSAAFCIGYLRKSLREMPAPFASTRDVLRRDAAALRPHADMGEPSVAGEPEHDRSASSL